MRDESADIGKAARACGIPQATTSGLNSAPAAGSQQHASRELSSQDKADIIRRWLDPEERVTIDFEDTVDLNARILACTNEVVELELETALPHYKQRAVLPLRLVDLVEDRGRYTRNPDKPLRYGQLWLIVHQNRASLISENG